jgi:hypothetical protein
VNKLILGQFDTDKDDKYLKTYEEVFKRYEDKPIELLELGVYHGGSLLLWSDHFPKGKIVGVDVNDIQLELPSNVIFEIGDQRDKEFLERITKEHTKNGFDVIIDDASHLGNFTEASFLICFNNLLKSKGIYVIEDWGTGYWSDWPDGKSIDLKTGHIIRKLRKKYKWTKDYEKPNKKSFYNHSYGMVGLVKQLIDELAIEDVKKSERKVKSWTTDIESILIKKGQVFIFKK